MASVKRVESSRGTRYRARYRAPDGTSKERWFTKKADADRFLTSVEHSKFTGAYVDPSAGKVTFRDYAEQWRHVQAHRLSTTASVETNLRRHVYPTIGDRPIGAVQRSEVQALVKGIGLAPSTVELIYRYVSAIFRSAVEDLVIPVSPCRRISLPAKHATTVTVPTIEQVATMANAVPSCYRALVLLAAASGLRQGELIGLTVDRVDWLRRTVTVDRQLVMLRDKVPSFGPPKTTASHRVVPLPDEALTLLTEHVRVHPPVDLPGMGRLLFADERCEPILRAVLARSMRPAARAAGMPPRTGLHVLRHFYASALIRHGESVKVVQERLGHASASETLDTYSHLWPDSEDRTRAAVSEALVGLAWGWEIPAERQPRSEGGWW